MHPDLSRAESCSEYPEIPGYHSRKDIFLFPVQISSHPQRQSDTKQAITYRVSNYLLKPCNENQIIEAVKKASAEIRKRKKIKELIPDTALTDAPRYQYKDYINQTLDYIDTHFSDPELSLKKIASDVLFMNVDYLSREFLRQTGQKFTDYLTKLRITKAKALLKNASYEKIYVVAEQVGFSNNPQYFVQLFKAATGQTPKAWAKMQQASEKET